MQQKKPTMLIILDGFGYRQEKKNNAIALAHTPHITSWFNQYPHALLQASGQAVGLLDGYAGNSEVGHVTIGSGRITPQPLTIIHHAISDGSFFGNPILAEHLHNLKISEKPLHIMGLLSDAGVHSHQELLYAFIKAAVNAGIKHIIIHPFLDGRDVPPQSAQKYLQQLDEYLKKMGCGIIGSIHGRFYAMDRDHNWDRTEQSYRVLSEKCDTQTTWQELLKKNYAENITDEFIVPTQLDPRAMIKTGDGVIFFNFRPDRARQLTQSLLDQNFKYFPTDYRELAFFITPVSYAKNLHTNVLFDQPPVAHTIKDVLTAHDKSIFSIAETEKYAHVTYFFSGGKEHIFHHEVRILIPSLVAHTYVEHPEMSASHITQAVLKSLKKNPKDFYLINYANADMVGHSGNLQATIKAVECLDNELQKLYEKVVEEMDGTMYITADHGKAEEMADKNGEQKTAHTTNSVPFIMIGKDLKNSDMKLPLTQLADIAPCILQKMELPVPEEMQKKEE